MKIRRKHGNPAMTGAGAFAHMHGRWYFLISDQNGSRWAEIERPRMPLRFL